MSNLLDGALNFLKLISSFSENILEMFRILQYLFTDLSIYGSIYLWIYISKDLSIKESIYYQFSYLSICLQGVSLVRYGNFLNYLLLEYLFIRISKIMLINKYQWIDVTILVNSFSLFSIHSLLEIGGHIPYYLLFI